jgi:phosphonate transport system permease protein
MRCLKSLTPNIMHEPSITNPHAAPAMKLPPPMFDARCKACWFTAALGLLVVTSFWSLNLQWAQFFSVDAARSMGRFVAEFFPPDLSPAFLSKVAVGAAETLAMSALGTAMAAVAGVALALPASQLFGATQFGFKQQGTNKNRNWLRGPTRLLLNALRSVPELVWAALLLISAGLGPMAGTLALALHTSGVLGRLFAEAVENAPPGPALALRTQGVGPLRVFIYATLPQVLPQLMSYTLYRWENNIRAAAVLGVVGAGGLGQLLQFHMGLFHMGKTATILGAMLLLVALVDLLSHIVRRRLTR